MALIINFLLHYSLAQQPHIPFHLSCLDVSIFSMIMGNIEARFEGPEVCFHRLFSHEGIQILPSTKHVFISMDVNFCEHDSFFSKPSLQGGVSRKSRFSYHNH